jgi:hypothetical protein
MYGQNETMYQDWVAEEWAGEDPTRDSDTTPHWSKEQWVGDRGHGLPLHIGAAQMLEGESGFSGFRHTPPASHWASAR